MFAILSCRFWTKGDSDGGFSKATGNLNQLILQHGLNSNQPGPMMASVREALSLMDAVLAVEPTHPAALKTRSELTQVLADASAP